MIVDAMSASDWNTCLVQSRSKDCSRSTTLTPPPICLDPRVGVDLTTLSCGVLWYVLALRVHYASHTHMSTWNMPPHFHEHKHGATPPSTHVQQRHRKGCASLLGYIASSTLRPLTQQPFSPRSFRAHGGQCAELMFSHLTVLSNRSRTTKPLFLCSGHSNPPLQTRVTPAAVVFGSLESAADKLASLPLRLIHRCSGGAWSVVWR